MWCDLPGLVTRCRGSNALSPSGPTWTELPGRELLAFSLDSPSWGRQASANQGQSRSQAYAPASLPRFAQAYPGLEGTAGTGLQLRKSLARPQSDAQAPSSRRAHRPSRCRQASALPGPLRPPLLPSPPIPGTATVLRSGVETSPLASAQTRRLQI